MTSMPEYDLHGRGMLVDDAFISAMYHRMANPGIVIIRA